MAMPIDLILVRHGQSEGNAAHAKSRRGDDSDFSGDFLNRHGSRWRLTDKGREQAKMASEWIRNNIGEKFFRYYVSEYNRAVETAALLNLPEAQWFVDFYLRERDWGLMETATDHNLKTRFAEDLRRRKIDSFYWTPPGGESLAQLCRRLDRVIGTLHRECADKKVIMVCHGEVMWAMRVRLERMTQDRFQELDSSKDPFDKIHNCQILHYSRINPETDEISPYLDWLKSVCPTDTTLSKNEWEKIERKRFTNEELLDIVNQYPQIVTD